jgi:mRNA interferase MazF
VVTPPPYVPDRGHVVWLSFDPQSGHEQSGHRPALAISPEKYNRKVGLALFCPITSRAKGYPFEVTIPEGLGIGGVVLADQVKNLDWKSRRAKMVCELPAAVTEAVLAKLGTLLR